jgi:superfamily I DNA/RNA helicase
MLKNGAIAKVSLTLVFKKNKPLSSMSKANFWVQNLNAEQRTAALHNHGPLLILAGAGSGKTTVLVSRTGRLIDEGVARPEQILVLTFTNKAARELKNRVAAKIGAIGAQIWAGTFHSFGLHILKSHANKVGLPPRFAIVDNTDSRALVKDILKDIYHGEKEAFDPEELLSLISNLREGKTPPASTHPADLEMAELVLPKYLAQLEMWGAVDFEGLLLKPLELFQKHPEVLAEYQERFNQVMVDEFQDTNKVQMKLVTLLSERHQNLAVVGDDDQSIYGWRGAVVANILDFPKKFKNCQVVRLEVNYRSTSKILDVANAVIAKNKKRHGKVLKSPKTGEESATPEVFFYESDEDEIEEIIGQIRYFQGKGFQSHEIAILFRSNSQGGLLEGHLRKNNIEYSLSGGSGLFDRKEVRDVLAFIRMSVSPNDLSLRRILNTPPRGIGKTTYQQLETWAAEKKISFFASLKAWREAGVGEKIGESIDHFLVWQDHFREFLSQKEAVEYSVELPKFLEEMGYKSYVYSSYKDLNTAHKKWTLIEIVGRIIDGFVQRSGRGLGTIRDFIDAMELRDQPDDENEDSTSKVQLLTLHACKGLEFPVVLMIGIEEGLLPHETLGLDIDEERRLFYVGATRAQMHLVFTLARRRKRYGKWRPSTPSRFLLEIPEKLVVAYQNGVRPLSETGRRAMLDQLYARLDLKGTAKAP